MSHADFWFASDAALLYALASDWYHVLECFVGRRAEFKGFFSEMNGAEVYVKVGVPR